VTPSPLVIASSLSVPSPKAAPSPEITPAPPVVKRKPGRPLGSGKNTAKKAAARKLAPPRYEQGPVTTGMRHRRPSADCPLCPIWGIAWDAHDPSTHNQQHIYAERLWRAWNGGYGHYWEGNVCLAAAELGVECTPDQARTHFRFHRVEQPMLSGSLQRDKYLYEASLLPKHSQDIVTAVYRHRMLSTEQIREVFFAGGHTKDHARWLANTVPIALASKHFLYRVYPDARMANKRDAPPYFAKQALWFLGKAAIPFIERAYGVTVWPDHYVQMAKEVSDVRLLHDLRANGIYVSLARALNASGGLVDVLDGQQAAVELLSNNWYGDKSLMLAFYNARHLRHEEIRADGFASLSVQRNQWGGGDTAGLPSCQLPFFYEYDRGSKGTSDVARQLIAYHMLARSRKANERFPDLNVEGYGIPVLMVFSTAARLRNTHREFLRLAKEEGLERGIPILLVAEEDWSRNPLSSDICYLAWEQQLQGRSFLDLLIRGSAPLIASRAVLASQTLAINPKVARRVLGAISGQGLELQRGKRQAALTDAAAAERGRKAREQQQEFLDTLRQRNAAATQTAPAKPLDDEDTPFVSVDDRD